AAALDDAAELTAHAVGAGVAGCLVVPPFYFKNLPEDGVFASFAALIDRMGGTGFNLFLYHFPQMSAVPIPHDVIRRLIEAYPGVIAGPKDSSGDLDNMLALIKGFPAMRIFSGTERYLLPVLEAGGAGCITAGGNITSSEIGRLYAHWRAKGSGPEADALQERVTELRSLLEGAPMIAAMKALLARHRNAPDLARAMPPMSAADNADVEALRSRLDAAGFALP
ncbi:MAG TPA: dihydrodipicolinate synthase family protein, partial [Alphaproteobacteria bacterium]|nr:dihydrodipicolinate synthase family protein [Alphaproteobacteria bacterium]